MCGISGYCGKEGSNEKLVKMTTAISRRGPDDVGFYESKDIGFGFRRLSIIDLATGHQPLSDEDKNIWVMLNGEIYDYKKLREELIEIGYKFKTKSDTEVIVHAYKEYGEECFKKLDGMFAIALWDSKKSKLFLARDRFGKKPLYWTLQKNTLWFASELKSLISADVIKKEIDTDSVALYFRNEFIPTPKTIFKNVWKLEPATVLSFENDKIEKREFWQKKEEEEKNLNEKDVLEKTQKIIDEAVKKRLVSDVPLGLFLSGGLDSTIIAESASRQNPGMEAFTLGFEDNSYDETEKARKIAKALGIKHHVEILSEKKALDMLDESINLLDEPLADPAVLPQLLLSQFTKKHVTVALSGDGGDELLLGYQHIKAHIWVEKLSFLPKNILNLTADILKKIPSGSEYFSFGFKSQRLSRGLSIENRFERDLAWRGAFDKKGLKKLLRKEFAESLNLEEAGDIMQDYAEKYGNPKSWSSWSFSYLRTYLMDDVMVKVDRATMWYGLEARAPLLDTKLVSFLLDLPDKYKLGEWRNKKLFKKLLENKIPEEVLNSPKHGFGVPIAKWLNGPLQQKLIEFSSKEFLDKQNIFNRDYILEIIDEHKSGRRDKRKELWAYLVFQLWYKRWIN